MNTEAWGILLGHTTGFAATRAAAQLQQAVPRNFFCVAFMPFVSFGCLGEIGEALGGTGRHWEDRRIPGKHGEIIGPWRET